MDRKRLLRNPLLWILVLVVLYYGFTQLFDENRDYAQVHTSQAIHQINKGNVSKAKIGDKEQQLKLDLKDSVSGSDKVITQYPEGASNDVFKALRKQDVNFDTKVTQDSFFSQFLVILIPVGLMLLLFMWVMNNAQGGGNKVLNFGKSKAKQLSKDMPKNTFSDVAGSDEAVEELYEIKDFLEKPGNYQALGAKIPKGVLLYGPPGTGKTLLARAVSGEAGVPFYSISGSDFVEMFVGVGASRVRDLFEQAKQNAPCIVFVDEIDAVGRQRGAGLGGGHDEREQTLNQLLVEMDGFDTRGGIILIAATNRPDILDPALLRPGRFDRQIPVSAPDLAGRKQILRVHSKGKPFGKDVDFESLAKRTIGMSGADLANVVNEAALLTARENESMISGAALEESVDRVVGGPRRKSKIISEKEKKLTAYHEGGHALAAWAMPDIEPVYKLTIVARGRTGGHALAVPEDDKDLMTRSEMIARLVFALGGRASEELVFHEPTTGASSDIDQATKIARSMVTEYGMSGRLGAVRYGQEQGDPFLGRSMGSQPDYSLEVAHEIDEEVRKLIEAAHTEAYHVLNAYREVLDDLVVELLDQETLQRKDLQRIFAPVQKRPRITDFNDFGDRVPSDKPPIKTRGELAKERGEPWPPAEDGNHQHQEPVPVPDDSSESGGQTNGAAPSPNGVGGQQGRHQQGNDAGQSGSDEPQPRHQQGGPPYYDAPPGWTPATDPSQRSAQPWRPSWHGGNHGDGSSQSPPNQQGWSHRDQNGQEGT